MRVPVITDEDAYVVGRVELLNLYCGPKSESFGLRYLFRIPVINGQICVLHRALNVVRMVLWFGHMCRMDKQNMCKEFWYGNLLKVIRFDENKEY